MTWGRLLHGTRKQPIGPRDQLIAATALACGMTGVIHNVRASTRTEGLSVEDWQVWAPEGFPGSGPVGRSAPSRMVKG
jgi:predicted nucleic acid-binding protein